MKKYLLYAVLFFMLFPISGTVYVENEALRFSYGNENTHYRIFDWRNQLIQNGKMISTLSGLPPGYYRLELLENGKIFETVLFSVVFSPEKRVGRNNGFFGFDSAHSWLCIPGKAGAEISTENLARLLKLAGASHVRDRLLWRDVEPSAGSFLPGRYLENAKIMRQSGIDVTLVYIGAPKFYRKSPVLPDDLSALFRFSERLSREFKGACDSWEYLNEPDLSHNSREPVWEVAAIQKAALLGLRSGNPGAKLLTTSVCEPDSAFAVNLAESRSGSYADGWNYHCYRPISEYGNVFARLRKMLQNGNGETMPIYLTELGTHAEGLCTPNSASGKNKKHSPEQEMAIAEFQAKAQIVLRHEGIAAVYTFVLPPYYEFDGHKDWGILRSDGSAKPVFAALTAQATLLDDLKIKGELKITTPGVRVFLFEGEKGQQLLAFWSVTAMDQGKVVENKELIATADRAFRLRLPEGAFALYDLFGGKKEFRVSNKEDSTEMTAERNIQYLTGLSGLQADIPAIICNSAASKTQKDQSIVIRPRLNANDFQIIQGRTLAIPQHSSGKITVEFWNLSPESKELVPEISGGTLTAMPESIKLPPMEKTAIETIFTPVDTSRNSLRIAGWVNGKEVTPAVVRYKVLEKILKNAEVRLLDIGDVSRWRRNTSGRNFRCSFDNRENAIRFDVEFPEPTRWIYPQFDLKTTERFSPKACMVQFEIKAVQDKVENDFVTVNLMLVRDDSNNVKYLPYHAPNGQWETRYISLDDIEFSPDRVKTIRIGMNPKGHKLTYWIRNFKIIE